MNIESELNPRDTRVVVNKAVYQRAVELMGQKWTDAVCIISDIVDPDEIPDNILDELMVEL